MPITVTCPACQFTLSAQDEHAGRRGKCPQCHSVVEIPALERSTSSPAAKALAKPAPRHAGTAAAPALPVAKPLAASAAAKPTPAKANGSNGQQRPLTPDQRRQHALAGFVGQVPPVQTSLAYKLGILLAALFMVLLPLVYVAIIGLACLVMFWHVTSNFQILGTVRGRGALFMLLVYLAPVVVGGIMILFMIKPLFARPAKEGRRRSLTPHSDPLLFEFVARICLLVRAPMPKRIDVDCDINASAGFRRGWLSMIAGSDLVLTIGLPLTAGLSLQQFAGVLAHEFGHFSQGTGMRLTYVIRSINHWFLRVVYERDAWDEWLAGAAEGLDLRIAWVLYAARLAVWITRKILWVLMFLGHLVAGFMLREMEFDADRYEAQLAGSDTFDSTCRQLRLLGFAWQGAQADLGSYYREGRLVDDLPALMVLNLKQLPGEAREAVGELIDKSKTGWMDSHPADCDRIASARGENAAGAFRSNLPAQVLFENFDAAAKNVTWDYYCAIFGRTIDPKSLHPTSDLMARQEQETAAAEGRDRFFAGGFSALRPLRLPVLNIDTAPSPAICKETLLAARQSMESQASGYRAAVEPYDQADTRLIQARQARSLHSCGVRVQHNKFDRPMHSTADATRERDQAQAEMGRMSGPMEIFENASGHRLGAALSLLFHQSLAARLPEAARLQNESRQLLPIVSLVANSHASILELRNNNAVLVALLGHLSGNERSESLVREVLDLAGRVRRQMAEIRSLFERIDYPFDHAQGPLTVAQFLVKMIPPEEEIGSVFESADDLLKNLMSLYARAIGRLCLAAEAVEGGLGLAPLKAPETAATPVG